MANIASARKRVRQTLRRNERNQARRSRVRGFVKKVELAVSSGDKTSAAEAFQVAQVELHRAVSRGVLHHNTASRKISRLAARVKALSVA